jgi:hypothetical protein
MSSQRILGIAVLIVGIVILCFGINASNSVADQVKQTFTGRLTDGTAWYIFGGLAMAVVGLLVSVSGPGGKSA